MNKNWEMKKLGEVIKLEYGKPLPDSKRKSDGAYPVYGANGEKDRTDEYYYDKQSIIVGRKGSAGEINLTENKFWPLDVTYFVTFDSKKYDLYFVYYLLSKLELQKLAKGVKPGINRNEVYSINVQIPQLPEQKHIVSILDETFAAIDKAKENAEKNLQNSRELFESYLKSVFANPEDEWEEIKLEDAFDIKHGFAFKSEFFSDKGDYVLLTPGNFFEEGGYRDRGEKQKYYTGEIPKGYVLKKDDLLIAMTEQAPGLLGSPIIIPESDMFLHNQRLGLIVHKENYKIDTKFLFYLFNTQRMRSLIHKSASGVKVRHTSPKKVLEITASIPKSLSEQQSIVAKLDALSAETKRLEEIYLKKLAALDELKKSVLQKAFNGELAGA